MKKVSTLGFILAAVVLVGAGCSGATGTDGSGAAGSNGASAGTGVIVVDAPENGATLDSPFKVEGSTSDETGAIYLRLLNADGDTIVSSQTTTDASGSSVEDYFLFNAVFYLSGDEGDGTLEVFGKDADGKEIDTVRIPVVIE